MTLLVVRHAPVEAAGIRYGRHDVPTCQGADATAGQILEALGGHRTRISEFSSGGGPGSQGITEERPDLDDVRTGIDEELARIGPGDLGRGLDHPQPGQGPTCAVFGAGSKQTKRGRSSWRMRA